MLIKLRLSGVMAASDISVELSSTLAYQFLVIFFVEKKSKLLVSFLQRYEPLFSYFAL